jgi:hypothetical protein
LDVPGALPQAITFGPRWGIWRSRRERVGDFGFEKEGWFGDGSHAKPRRSGGGGVLWGDGEIGGGWFGRGG